MPNQAIEATETQPLVGKEKQKDDVETGEAKPSTTTTMSTKASESVLDDAIDIFRLAFPIFITSFSWVGVSVLTLIWCANFTIEQYRQ